MYTCISAATKGLGMSQLNLFWKANRKAVGLLLGAVLMFLWTNGWGGFTDTQLQYAAMALTALTGFKMIDPVKKPKAKKDK